MRRATGSVAVGIVLCVASAANAQDHDEIRRFSSDCVMTVECAIEAPALTYQAGVGERIAPSLLQTHVSFAHMDRRCPRSGQLSARVSAPSCVTTQGSASSPYLVQGTAYGKIVEGFATYALPLTYEAYESLTCHLDARLTFSLDNGQEVETTCTALHALGINKSGVEMTLTGADRITAYGSTTPLTLHYTAQSEQEASYDLSFPAMASPSRYSAGFHVPTQDAMASCAEPPLDELTACSSDQRPVCGCDGRMWDGACEATRAGVSIASDSPGHPLCQRGIYFKNYGEFFEQREPPDFGAWIPPSEEQMCSAPILPQVSFQGRFTRGEFTQEVALRGAQRQPHHFIPVYALLAHGPRNLYHHSALVRQDIHAIPPPCDQEDDYRLHACSRFDPCCGYHPDLCDARQARLSWCLFAGDRDCDGVPDAQEVSSDPRKVDTDEDGVWDRVELSLGLVPQNPDTDGDGLTDGQEWQAGLDPLRSDTDGDGLNDEEDASPRLEDHDRDGLIDGLDLFPEAPDRDFDGLLDGEDDAPEVADRDGDGLLDGAEAWFGFDPDDSSDAVAHGLDTDGDGLNDAYELRTGTDAGLVDTDGDGLSDLLEILAGCDPLNQDTDGDGLDDFEELRVSFTNPVEADSDGDGLLDADEVRVTRSSPWLVDTDGDGLGDALEVLHLGSSPLRRDTDGGGLDDLEEWYGSGDPRQPDDDAEQVRERHVPGPGDKKPVFSRAPGEPVVTFTTEIEEVNEHVEVLSERIIAMPYHHMKQQHRVRLPPNPTHFARLRVILRGEVMNFDFERSDRVDHEGRESEGEAQFAWRQAPGTLPETVVLVNVKAIVLITDPTTGEVSEPRARSTRLGSDQDLYLDVEFEPGSLSQDSVVTVVMTTRVEVIGEVPAELCNSFMDEDLDGKRDCEDPDCQNDESCFVTYVEICHNALDDDFNGLIDCEDPACQSQCFEAEVCDDFIDNDGDGLLDLEDPDCAGFCPSTGCDQPRVEICNDGIDNDFNGLIDRQDPWCQGEDCEDGIDNDGDGFTDCLDEKCAMDFFCCNIDDNCAGEVCNDGFDNDFDGLIDCKDEDCALTMVCAVPGIPPRKSLRDRLGEGCGCGSVTRRPEPSELPRELLVLGVLGLCWGVRRRPGQGS